MRSTIRPTLIVVLATALVVRADTLAPPTGGGLQPIPADDKDLSGIKDSAESYQTLADACRNKKCPDLDCGRALAAMQALSDLEANLAAMLPYLQMANDDAMKHFESLARQGIITGDQLSKTIFALGLQRFLHDFGSALLDIASVASTINEVLQDPSKLKDPSELISNLDALYEGLKDAESAATNLASSLSGQKIEGPLAGVTPGAFGLSPDAINDHKSTLSDAISIVKEIQEKGGDVKEALKKPAGPGAAIGQIVGRYLKAYSASVMAEREKAIEELNRDLAASDTTQAASYLQLRRISSRRFAAEDALAAVKAAQDAMSGCLAKAGCTGTLTRPVIPTFASSGGGVTLANWGKALDHFNAVLPQIAARLLPQPMLYDKVPCDEPKESFIPGFPAMPLLPGDWTGLDFDGGEWCTFGGGSVPLIPGTGGPAWGAPMGPSIPWSDPLMPGGPGGGGLPATPGGPKTTTPAAPGGAPQSGGPRIPTTPSGPGGVPPVGGPVVGATPSGPSTTAKTTPTPTGTPIPTPTPTPASAAPPTFTFVVKAKQTVLQGGVPTTSAMPGAQLQLNLFPEPALPGAGQARDESTGADQPPTKLTTGPDGSIQMPAFELLPDGTQRPRGPLPPIDLDVTPQSGSILGFQPGLPNPLLGMNAQLVPFLDRTFMLDGQLIGVFRYPAYDAAKIEGLLGQMPGVQYMEPNFCREIQVLPGDPYFTSRSSWKQPYDDQWAIKRVGFTSEPGSAFELAAGARPVVVAVIDTGLDWNHEDLPWEALWTNPRETAGNGIDDDRNGFVDDVIGWDFWRNTNKPWDRNGHGTLVAGIIAARSGNGRGIAGVNPQARIMVIKALNSFGHTRASFIAQAILYAADNGAQVINISVGGKRRSKTEQRAVEYAHRKGAVIVVASGNEGVSVDEFGPGGVPQVITVAATGVDDKRAPYSNWGPGVDLAAPGNDVLGPRARYTDLMMGIPGVQYKAGDAFVGTDRRYTRASGTSFAAPIVSGVASLLVGKGPKVTSDGVKRRLLATARDVDVPGVDQFTGHGLLDAVGALSATAEFSIEAAISGVAVTQKGGRPFVQVTGTAAADQLKTAWIEIGAGESPTQWKKVSRDLTQPIRAGVLDELDAESFRSARKWTLRLVVEHKNGQRREARFLLSLG